jgi:hypothetical protein
MTKRRSTLHSAAAAALAGLLASQLALAQSVPGAERAPAGQPGAGDSRATPGPERRQDPASHPSDRRPLLRQPGERSMEPDAADPRTTPRGDIRRPDSATTRETRRDGPDAGVAQSGMKP